MNHTMTFTAQWDNIKLMGFIVSSWMVIKNSFVCAKSAKKSTWSRHFTLFDSMPKCFSYSNFIQVFQIPFLSAKFGDKFTFFASPILCKIFFSIRSLVSLLLVLFVFCGLFVITLALPAPIMIAVFLCWIGSKFFYRLGLFAIIASFCHRLNYTNTASICQVIFERINALATMGVYNATLPDESSVSFDD